MWMALGRFDRDSQIRSIQLQHADWNGGRHGWANQYSMDFREREVAAVEIGALSCHQAAAQSA